MQAENIGKPAAVGMDKARAMREAAKRETLRAAEAALKASDKLKRPEAPSEALVVWRGDTQVTEGEMRDDNIYR